MLTLSILANKPYGRSKVALLSKFDLICDTFSLSFKAISIKIVITVEENAPNRNSKNR